MRLFALTLWYRGAILTPKNQKSVLTEKKNLPYIEKHIFKNVIVFEKHSGFTFWSNCDLLNVRALGQNKTNRLNCK